MFISSMLREIPPAPGLDIDAALWCRLGGLRLATFTGANGAYPNGCLIADANGDLFGMTSLGGANSNDGTVFELVKGGASYALNTLITFTGANGANPQLASLIAERSFRTAGIASQPGRCRILSKTTFLPHQEARMMSGAAANTSSGEMIRSLAAFCFLNSGNASLPPAISMSSETQSIPLMSGSSHSSK